ncbi:cyclic nucleotide-binding domain-containing protein [Spirosoma harenae]
MGDNELLFASLWKKSVSTTIENESALYAHFETFIKLSDSLKQELYSRLKPVRFRKGELIHHADAICTRSYFIQKGLVRTFFVKDGREISEYFSAEGEWVNSPRSLMQRKPDNYFIDAIESTDTFCLHINDLGYLFDNFPEMERYARLSMGSLFGHFMERITSMRFSTAREKYDHFCEVYHGVYPRIPLGMIASYLGITQETLSRIRAER